MESLTKRQGEILQYLKDSIREGIVPSFREIMAQFKFRGIKTVQDHLDALERKRYIRRNRGKARSLEVLGLTAMDSVQLPILGRIAAGSPILAEENIEGTIAVDKTWVKGRNSFILKVQGDSMIGAGIYDGDYAIVKQDYTAENGDIVAAMVDSEVTLKRFFRQGRDIMLRPENPLYEDITVKNGDTGLSIIGKLTGIYRQVKNR